MRIEDSVGLVTGGASGIGRAMALELARRGASVVIADCNEERMVDAIAELEAVGSPALGVMCDVTSDADVERLRDVTYDRFGRVDVLCNNVGVSVQGPPERVALEDWEWILQVNVLGPIRGVRAFVPAMIERGAGHVVNTASVAGTWAYTWDCSPYITSKFAVYGFSESLARRLHPHGVGVSVLCPGLVMTNIAENVRVSGVPEGIEWSYFPEEMKRPVSPAEVGVLVADAVEKRTFAIFTHPEDEARFRRWHVDIEGSLADVVASSPPPPVLP